MKVIASIAVACMSMWVVGDANAQETEPEINEVLQQQQEVEGEPGQRGRKGQRGKGGKGKRGGADRQQGQRRGGLQMIERLFNRFDTDKDGNISETELPEKMKQRFANLDSNGDKSVSKEEMNAAFERMRGERSGQGKKGDKNAEKGGKRGRGQMDVGKLIERADQNKDGVISIDEAPERMKKSFDKIDSDGSGTVTVEELKATFESMRQGGGKKGKSRGRNKADAGKNKSPEKPKRPPMAEDGA